MSTVHPAQTSDKPDQELSTIQSRFPDELPRKQFFKRTGVDAIPDEMRRKRFLKRTGVAALLDIDPKTLAKMWRNGEGPRRRVLGARLDGCTIGDIEDYLEASIVS